MFSHLIGFLDPFMDDLAQPHQLPPLVDFMDSVQCGDHLGGGKRMVNSGSAKEAVEHVGKVIFSHGERPEPIIGPDGKLHMHLNYQ